jgi:hypothetical protein
MHPELGKVACNFFSFYWVNILNKQIGLDPGNSLIKADVSKRFPQYLKFEGGPTYILMSKLIRILNFIFV